MARKQRAEQRENIAVYVNSGCQSVYDKMQEVRRRRGYPKDLMIWEILVDLDEKLTETEEELKRIRETVRQDS